MKSDHSMNLPVTFSGDITGDLRCPETGGAVSKMSSSEETETDNGTHGPARKSHRVRVERAGSPVPSCLSMKSDRSMPHPINFRGEFTGDQRIHCSQVSNHIVER
ncbi:hypothetical protein ANANG_G00307650, partial [Anguilla anguilla]